MSENLIVFFIIAVAAAYIGRVYYRKYQAARQSDNPCSCNNSCEGCQANSDLCDDMQHKTDLPKYIDEKATTTMQD